MVLMMLRCVDWLIVAQNKCGSAMYSEQGSCRGCCAAGSRGSLSGSVVCVERGGREGAAVWVTLWTAARPGFTFPVSCCYQGGAAARGPALAQMCARSDTGLLPPIPAATPRRLLRRNQSQRRSMPRLARQNTRGNATRPLLLRKQLHHPASQYCCPTR